jgi:hypothetical protein
VSLTPLSYKLCEFEAIFEKDLTHVYHWPGGVVRFFKNTDV